MTIGEKIRYYRKQLGITQGKLAELTGIHPVSIRKYEINKMQPQPQQIERIAAALNVNCNALNGIEHAGMRLETVGDLLGMLMVLCNTGIIQIEGERGRNDMLEEETVNILFNPVLSSYLEMEYSIRGKQHNASLQDTLLIVRNDNTLRDFLKWEKMNYLYKRSLKAAQKDPCEAKEAALKEITEAKEITELELQKSRTPLTF